MIFLAILTVSLVALSRLSIDLLPDVSFPTVTVVTANTGMGPEEIERNITEKIEETVGTVSNIKNINSISVEEMSIVTIEFEWGIDMGEAAADVREKIDLVADNLPDTATKPRTFKLDASMIPVYGFVIGGASISTATDFAEDVVQIELEQIEGVSMAWVEGGREEQIQINIDRDRLKAYNLSFDQVVKIVAAENVNQPAGNIRIGHESFTIRTEGEFQNLEQIRKVVVGVQGTREKKPVFLEDIATVVKTFKDRNEVRIVGQSETVAIICQKQSGANTVEVVNKILKKMESIEKRAPKGMYFKEIMNGADYIERSIGNIAGAARDAGILAIFVVLFFLKNLRSTLIIAISIPTSVIVTFLLMFLGDITLNLMSFGGLALGVGMLVDNAIVVLENIYRHRELGEDKVHAAIKGAREVAMPITASTLTTICVFLPLLFVQGVAGEFFKEMSLTVAFSLLGSLVVALTLIPMLSSKLIAMVDFENKKFRFSISKKIYHASEGLLQSLDRVYTRFVHWALRHRKTIIFGTVGLFIFSMILMGFVQRGFMPESDNDRMTVDIELKQGTRLEITQALAFNVSEKISKVEGVKTFTAVMGTGDNFFSVMQGKTGSHFINGSIRLQKSEEREQKAWEIRAQIRDILDDIPGIEVTFYRASLMSSNTSPLEIEVRGNDLDAIFNTATKIQKLIKKSFSKELKDVRLSRTEGTEELVVRINRIKAATMGFNVAMIANTIQNNFIGATASRYRFKGDELDILVRLQESQRLTRNDLENITIKSPLGFSVPISQVVSLEVASSPVKIERTGQQRVVYVRANNAPEVGIANIVNILRDRIQSEIVIPEGVNLVYGGSYEDTQESFGDLGLALMLAILLIYMIMAAQFESFLNPFIILFTIPLSFIGVAWIIFLTGGEFTVISFIGVIILTGIVVNNGIVLIDYIRQLRTEHGYELFHSIIEAGRTRLRPILMTALTTIIGMLPMALGTGSGSEARAPMALAIVGGLTVSTLLTLIFVPVIYSVFEGYIIKRHRRKAAKGVK
jgi:HAE1 family hydrophobic/amphiphilic exporter-1